MGEGVRDGRGESELADYVTVCYTGTETVSERSSQNAGYHQRRVNYTDSNICFNNSPASLLPPHPGTPPSTLTWCPRSRSFPPS